MGAPEKLAAIQPQSPEQIISEISEWLTPIFQELSKSGLRITSPAFAVGVLVGRWEGLKRDRDGLKARVSALESENKWLEKRVQNLSLLLDGADRLYEQELARTAINAGQNKPNQWSPPPIRKEAFA